MLLRAIILSIVVLAVNGVSNSVYAQPSFNVCSVIIIIPEPDLVKAISLNDTEGSYLSQVWITFFTVLLVSVLLLAFYLRRISRLKKIFEERNAMSKDLHDEIGATLSSINIYSEIAREKSDGNGEVDSMLAKIYTGSQQALESINDIVWYQDPRNDHFEDVVIKMRSFAIPALEAQGIETEFDVSDNILDCGITSRARHNTYRIFKDAINNILKYSDAKHAGIKMVRKWSYISVKIEDDGIGFDVSKIDKGSGFNNMIHRADAMNGVFRLNAAPGKGCSIELLCPIA